MLPLQSLLCINASLRFGYMFWINFKKLNQPFAQKDNHGYANSFLIMHIGWKKSPKTFLQIEDILPYNPGLHISAKIHPVSRK